MTQADRVYSTPPASSPAIPEGDIGAHGAVKLSVWSPILTRPAGACQPVGREREPKARESTSTERAGVRTLSRRLLMNMFVSFAAVATAAPAVAVTPNDEMLAIDNEAVLVRVEQIVDLLRTRYIREGWRIDEQAATLALDYFRRQVHGPAYADEEADTAALHQAQQFLSSHGQSLDWVHDGNLVGMICNGAHHSKRANEITDAELLALEEKIFELDERAHAHDEEINQQVEIWRSELERLEEARWNGGPVLTAKERSEAIRAMPAHQEHVRLASIAEPIAIERDQLIKKMWTIPARTAEGRRSKLLVLLSCVMRSGWTEVDKDADWDVEMARKLMIEFVGGAPAEELRGQFA